MNEEQARLEKYLNASTRQLVWWRFKKHTLAMIGLVLVIGLYVTALFCELLAPYDKDTRSFDAVYFSAH